MEVFSAGVGRDDDAELGGGLPDELGSRWGLLPVAALVLACALAVACSPGGGGRVPEATTGSPDASAVAVPAAALAWERLPEAPSARTEVTATSDGERIIVVGGLLEGGGTVALVEVYDPRARSWERGPDLPVGVNHAMSAALGGAVYVFGGYLGPGLTRPTDRAFALREGRWHELDRKSVV